MMSFFKRKSTMWVMIIIAVVLSTTYFVNYKKSKNNYIAAKSKVTKSKKVSKATSIVTSINKDNSYEVFQKINMDVNKDGFIDLVELSRDINNCIWFSIKDGKDNSIMGKIDFYQGGDKNLNVIPGDFYGDKRIDFFIKNAYCETYVQGDDFLITSEGNSIVPLINTEPDNGINIDKNINYEFKYNSIRFWSKNIRFNTNIKLSAKQVEVYRKNESTARRTIGFGEAHLNPKDVDKDGVFELEYTTDFHISKRQKVANIIAVFKYLNGKWKLVSADAKPVIVNKAVKQITEVNVSNVDELLDAIGSNKHIKLRKGIYNVSKCKDMIAKNKKFNYAHEGQYDTAILKYGVNYVDISDGRELSVNGVDNLTIEGLGNERVEIVADPRDAYIFRFNNSDNITLKNLKIGHTVKDETFICNAGVIKAINVQNFNISNCLLYGCGTIGIYAYDADNVNFDNSIIEKCTYGIMWLDKSTNINFTNSKLRKCKDYSQILIKESQTIKFSNCEITDNKVCGNDFSVINCFDTKDVKFLNCKFKRNKADVFVHIKKDVNFKGCTFEDNTFDGKW